MRVSAGKRRGGNLNLRSGDFFVGGVVAAITVDVWGDKFLL